MSEFRSSPPHRHAPQAVDGFGGGRFALPAWRGQFGGETREELLASIPALRSMAPKPGGPRVSKRVDDEIVGLYVDGMSIAAVSRELGMAKRTVSAVLHRRGVIRDYGGPRHRVGRS